MRLIDVLTLRNHSPSYVLGRFRVVRRTYALAAAAVDGLKRLPRPGSMNWEQSVLGGLNVPEAVTGLRQDAITMLPPLPAGLVREIEQYARTAPCTAPEVEGTFLYSDVVKGVGPDGKPVALAHAQNPLDCPAVARLSGDPVLAKVVRDYLGYAPRKKDVNLYWSFAASLSDDQRRRLNQTIDYHFDVHDYNFCYVHVYLTDTDRESGAHVMVRGSHRNKPVSWLFGSARRGDAQVEAYYPPDRILVLEGPAGTGFIEDTSCYHKALPPVTRDRLLLQIRYH